MNHRMYILWSIYVLINVVKWLKFNNNHTSDIDLINHKSDVRKIRSDSDCDKFIYSLTK